MTTYPKDARLWSYFIDEIRELRPDWSTAQIEERARRLIAWVRVAREDGAMSWAPGEAIPKRVTRVYDLDGDVWTRAGGAAPWMMPGFDPDEHEGAAAEAYDTAELLRRYGPLTEAPKRGTDSTSPRS